MAGRWGEVGWEVGEEVLRLTVLRFLFFVLVTSCNLVITSKETCSFCFISQPFVDLIEHICKYIHMYVCPHPPT
jgi:hypothetical protein